MGRSAPARIRGRHVQHMLLDRPVVIDVMQMAVVQIVDMPLVANRRVTTIRTVLVVVVLVNPSHRIFSAGGTWNA